ncbi:MAG: DUF3794 domain-containing protein [Clostridia bacterium]
MPINTERKNLNLMKCSLNEEISTWIEQDIIVPDSKPDAVKVINVCVTPYVEAMDVMDNKIKVMGKLNYFVIYKVNDEKFNNRGLFMSYPYTEVLELNGVNKDMDVSIEPCARNVIYSLPNERKIAIKTEVIFKTKVKNKTTLNLINKFSTNNEIECKMQYLQFNNILQTKKDIITSKEDIMLPKDADDFFELLKVDTKIVNTEYKESYNKIMVKGDIEIKMIYLAENSDENIKKITTTIPFSAMIELDNITDNSKFNIEYTIQDFNIKLNEDITTTKTMLADFNIEVEVTMFEEEDVEYIEDFYSQVRELSYDNNIVDMVLKDTDFVKRVELRENLTNIILPNFKLLDTSFDISNIKCGVNKNIVTLDGNAKVSFLIQNMDTLDLDNKTIDLAVSQNFELDNIDDKAKVYVNILDTDIYVSQNGTDIEIKATLTINVHIENVATLNIIENIVDSELDIGNLDSINIYIVKPGDTLWNIAKKYKTSVDKIIRTNGFESPDILSVGQKILIIR